MNNIIGIIGGAMAGVLVTLEYLRNTERSDNQTTVHLYDQNDQIFGKNSTSSNQCFKLHTGMHYLNDLETAKKCLLASIEFAREYPDCIMQKTSDLSPDDLNKYTDRVPGRFYIVSGGAISIQGARTIAKELNKLYQEMIEKDHNNAVFGPAEGFIKEIPISEDLSAPENIDFTDKNGKRSIRSIEGLLEVREAQIDIDIMRARLARELQTYEERGRLKIHLSTQVDAIQIDPNTMGYILKLNNLNNHLMRLQKVDVVANCTWQNMLDVEKELPQDIRTFIDEGTIDVRGKISVLVQLPEGFENFTTRIFASGPFCSITMMNLEKREAILTFSPKSDLKEYTTGQAILPNWVSHLNLQNDIAQEILKGCASFIPEKNGLKQKFLNNTKILEIRLAHVCCKNSNSQNYDLEDPHSSVHQRRESGIDQRFLGLVRYACTKMTYGPEAAREVAKILIKHLGLMQKTNRNVIRTFREQIIQYKKEQAIHSTDILDIISQMLLTTSTTALYISSPRIQLKPTSPLQIHVPTLKGLKN